MCGNNSYPESRRTKQLQKFTAIAEDLDYTRYYFQKDWHKIGFVVDLFLNMAPVADAKFTIAVFLLKLCLNLFQYLEYSY